MLDNNLKHSCEIHGGGINGIELGYLTPDGQIVITASEAELQEAVTLRNSEVWPFAAMLLEISQLRNKLKEYQL